MTAPHVSVVVVSRGRPTHLLRCLLGLSQLWYDPFEIVVVADGPGCDMVRDSGFSGQIKLSQFDTPNISAARNIGIGLAAGNVIAFIDDDAVPEPTWLIHLVAPFADPNVAQTGGYVRGRNGISFQWRGRVVNGEGIAREVVHESDAPFTPATNPEEAVKTEGTNMAVRREMIAQIGGFDTALHFYLDETDVNLRLATQQTVLVPLAQVHHGFGPSDHRAADRAARDLTQIAASSVVFWRKHLDPSRWEAARQALRAAQHKRLLGQVATTSLGQADIDPLMKTLENGFREGERRKIAPVAPIGPATHPFLHFMPRTSGPPTYLAGRSWQRKTLAARAKASVAQGAVTTVLCLAPTLRRHRVQFHPDGYWEQRGGLFGPSDRTQPPFKWWRFGKRVLAERARVAKMRDI